MTPRYPCTGHVDHAGFGAFVEAELGEPRRNLLRLADDLKRSFASGFVTLTNSGSSANLAAAYALREARPDRPRALVAGLSFPTTLASLIQAGWQPTLVDVDEQTFGLDPAALEQALTPDVGLVCVTHFLGRPAALERIADATQAAGALLLQDGCETMALQAGGRAIHGFGDVVTHSFYHPHHLPAHGGGAVVTDDERLARIVSSVVHWGRACSHQDPDLPCEAPPGPGHFFAWERLGYNLQMSELNACFARWQRRDASAAERRRTEHYAALRRALAGVPGLQTWPDPDAGCSPFVFPVAARRSGRAALADRLGARGVEARVLPSGHDQPPFADLPSDGLPVTRDLAGSTLMLGVHQTLPTDDVADVARIVREEAAR